MEYKAVFIDGVLHMIKSTLSHEVLDGIEQREVNKAKGA